MNRTSHRLPGLRWIAAALMLAFYAASSRSATVGADASTPTVVEIHRPTVQPGPVLSSDSGWAGAMVIVIISMFAMAAVIGPVVRANLPTELPVIASHTEDPHLSQETHDHGHGHH